MIGKHHTYADPKETAAASAKHILGRLEDATAGGRLASLAVSGGSTPKLLFEAFAGTPFDWTRVHLFWVDERGVPPDHEQSNYRLAEQAFLRPASFPTANVHRIQAELQPELAAEQYIADLRGFFGTAVGEVPKFDIIHQGMGPDAHTASLFPGEPLIEDRETLAAALYSQKMSQWRITLAPAVLLAARHTVMLVTGADKVEALRHVLGSDYAPLQYPTQIMREAGDVVWFMDRASAEGAVEPL
ncbi:MAG: 6-phosphogluconolactonase [Bryobacteraceae bacterium]